MKKAVLLLIYCCSFVSSLHEIEKKFWFPRRPFPRPPQKCVTSECAVAITTRDIGCQNLRFEDILRAKAWYKITNSKSTIAFPFAKDLPWLDQTLKNIPFYYALDPFESKYLMKLSTWRTIFKDILGPTLVQKFAPLPFTSESDYVTLFRTFNYGLANLKAPQYFGNPSQYPDFTDQITNGKWQTDEAFVQRRLAGECPFLMKKVVRSGIIGIEFDNLKKVLNYDVIETLKFKVSPSESLSIHQAIDNERLFVLYLPDLNNITAAPDLLQNQIDADLVMRSLKSQITLFVLKEDGEFDVVAIQTDSQKDAKVLTPDCNANEWQIAKAEVELTAHSYCQGKMHMGGIHLVTTVYCLTFRRHLSTRHPLFDFFKFHCEGTIPHITQAYPIVFGDKENLDTFYTVGSKAVRDLSKKEYDERNYETFTLERFIEGNGLDDKRIKYYPFRDDAEDIMKEFHMFATELVDSIYPARHFFHFLFPRPTIDQDKELQSWAAELSSRGEGTGNMIGFPKAFDRYQLKTFIKRFLFYNVFHTSVNYPLAPNFSPIAPTKLYKNKTNTPINLYESLLGGKLAAAVVLGRGSVSSFRANRIFDYFKDVPNSNLRCIVKKYHDRLHNYVQNNLAKRNAERKSKNQLGYQYLEPKWLTNSVHI